MRPRALLAALAAVYAASCVVSVAGLAGPDIFGHVGTAHAGYNGEIDGTPPFEHNWRGGVVLKGYDVIAYRTGTAGEGVKGNKDLAHNLTSSGYQWEFWFSTEENLNLFKSDPWKYAPKYGGFDTLGTARNFLDSTPWRWPWTETTWGPPAKYTSAFTVHEDGLYLFAANSYVPRFEEDPRSFTLPADLRWEEYFGSLKAGPFNTRCFPNQWKDCFDVSLVEVPVYGREASRSEQTAGGGAGSFTGTSSGVRSVYQEFWDDAPSPPAAFYEDYLKDQGGQSGTSSPGRESEGSPTPNYLVSGLGVVIAIAWGGAAWAFIFA